MDLFDFKDSLGGYKYLLLILDRWSSLVWDYYLKDKEGNSIALALASLFGILQRQFQIQPTVVESDNEFNQGAIKAFLQRHSVRIEPSAAYTPAQNGGAERSGGIIKRKILA